MQKLTQEELKRKLRYDPATGIFYRACNSGCAKAGDVAGSLNKLTGYVHIRVGGKRYMAHRLAWLYMVGRWPKDQIDHVDNVRNNNRFSNLREANNTQNKWNTPLQKNNSSGYKGVYYFERLGKWRAQICKNRKITYLGFYESPEAASEAYKQAAKKLHGKFAAA